MAFQLEADESVSKGIRRLIKRQLENALEGLKNARPQGDEAIHDARKRLKKVRAVLRLVRKDIGEKVYRRENTALRDAARPLTEVRDAKILIEALDQLAEHFADSISPSLVERTRRGLLANRRAIRKRVLEQGKAIKSVTKGIGDVEARINKRFVQKNGWAAIRSGLQRVYKAGRQAMGVARSNLTVETLHEWRKQAKYHWHQLQVLEPVWPELMTMWTNQVHELTGKLGDDHDLAVLHETLTADPDNFGGEKVLDSLLALIERRREELQQEAFALGRRIYADKPRDLAARLQCYWKVWRR